MATTTARNKTDVDNMSRRERLWEIYEIKALQKGKIARAKA